MKSFRVIFRDMLAPPFALLEPIVVRNGAIHQRYNVALAHRRRRLDRWPEPCHKSALKIGAGDQPSLLEISSTLSRRVLMTSSFDIRTPTRSMYGTASAATPAESTDTGADMSVTPGTTVLGIAA